MRYFIYLLIFLSSTAFSAEESSWLDRFQFHGFASQAFVVTTDNNFFGDSDHGSADFTELGINTSFRISPKLRVAGQLLSRHAGEMDNGSPRIDYALLDINLMSTQKGRVGAYLGRIKNPVGLYNETRDVAHTRQGVFAPQVIYFDKVRDLTLSADGIQLYGEYYLPNGFLLLQAGTGYPIPDKNVEHAYLGQDWDGKLKGDNLALIGRIMYEHDGGRWIFSASGASIELDFDHRSSDNAIPFIGITSGSVEIDYSVLSAQYNGEKWQFTTEVAIQDVEFENLGGLFENQSGEPLAYMFEANYKFTPKWQSFIRYELFYFDRDDRYGRKSKQELQATSNTISFLTGGAVNVPVTPSYSGYSRSWVIGGRWDINKNLMARTEYHWFDGTAILSSRENDITTAKRSWDMFAVSLSYHF